MSRKRPTADPFDVVRRMRYATDTVAVGFSCGKDSCAVLDLCLTWFNRVAVFYMWGVCELEFHDKYLRWWEKRCGQRLVGGRILKMPHWALAGDLRSGALRDFNPSFASLPNLKIRDIEMHVAKETGVTWFAYGQKKADSLERRAMLNKANGIMLESNRGFPLAEWTNRTVTQYLRDRGIPLSPEYEFLGCSYGGQLDARHLRPIKENFPGDYARIRERFPYVEAELARDDIRRSEGQAKIHKQQA